MNVSGLTLGVAVPAIIVFVLVSANKVTEFFELQGDYAVKSAKKANEDVLDPDLLAHGQQEAHGGHACYHPDGEAADATRVPRQDTADRHSSALTPRRRASTTGALYQLVLQGSPFTLIRKSRQ